MLVLFLIFSILFIISGHILKKKYLSIIGYFLLAVSVIFILWAFWHDYRFYPKNQ